MRESGESQLTIQWHITAWDLTSKDKELVQSALAPDNIKGRVLKDEASKPITVLLSGGLDSSVAVAFYVLERKFKLEDVHPLFIDYGQEWVDSEFHAAGRIASFLGLELTLVTVPLVPLVEKNPNKRLKGYIPFRNIHLLGVACNWSISYNIYTITGGFRYGAYPDTTQEFFDRYNFMLDSGVFYKEAPFIEVPFVWYGSIKMFNLAKRLGIPTEATRSCQAPGVTACGKCSKCLARKKHLGHF